MRRLYLMSIWAPHMIPADEWKYRNLKRVMFPVIDVLFFLGGLSAARYGIPAISEFFTNSFVDVFSYVLCSTAIVCIIGVSFPKLWAIEIGGKAVLLGLIIGYIASLFILTAVGKDSRGFVLIIAMIAVCPVVWRLSLLGSEWQIRRLVQNKKLALLEATTEEGMV